MKAKVVVLDPISQTGVDILRQSLDVDVLTGKSEEEILGFAADYQGMVVRSQTTVTPAILKAAKNLRIIGRAGVGVDNIDVSIATERGIVVINSPEGNTIAAAEQALALMFALARHLPQAAQKVQEGVWDRKTYVGNELYGKTIGVIGLGKIGGYVAKSAAGLNMDVLGFDPGITTEKAQQLGARLVPLEDLIAQSDFISFHTPLNDHTRGMVNKDFLARCKKGVRLINCARGGLIDNQALVDAVNSGHVAGAALDVFEKEPLPADSVLRGIPNIILTPHLGASTVEAQENVALDVCRQIRAYLADDEPVATAVNMPALTSETLAKVSPYLDLARHLGSLISQINTLFVGDKPHRKLAFTLTHRGPLSQRELDLVGRSLIVGQFADLHEDLNLVNAPMVMERQGMSITHQITNAEDFLPNSLRVTADIDGEAFSVAAHLDLDGTPKIHQVGPYRVDLVPQGRFLITRHHDRPGMIGRVGTLLGANNVNIAGMMVGRKDVRGEALMLLHVDDEVSEELLKELRAIDGLGAITQLRFQ